MMTKMLVSAAALLVSMAITTAAPARADSLADFYKDKTLTMIVGFPPGGLNDLSAPLVARFIAKHLPGSPRHVWPSWSAS